MLQGLYGDSKESGEWRFGAGYFDKIATTVDPNSSTTALKGSTEEGQFH